MKYTLLVQTYVHQDQGNLNAIPLPYHHTVSIDSNYLDPLNEDEYQEWLEENGFEDSLEMEDIISSMFTSKYQNYLLSILTSNHYCPQGDYRRYLDYADTLSSITGSQSIEDMAKSFWRFTLGFSTKSDNPETKDMRFEVHKTVIITHSGIHRVYNL